jgi:uncharacterized short protein YbdD (DUF466 family)
MDFKIARQGSAVIVKIIKFTIMSQKHLLLSPKNWSRIAVLWQRLQQSFRLMVGVPDYDNYVAHMKVTHPDQTPMTYEEFFKERQDARYGGKGGFKCC